MQVVLFSVLRVNPTSPFRCRRCRSRRRGRRRSRRYRNRSGIGLEC